MWEGGRFHETSNQAEERENTKTHSPEAQPLPLLLIWVVIARYGDH